MLVNGAKASVRRVHVVSVVFLCAGNKWVDPKVQQRPADPAITRPMSAPGMMIPIHHVSVSIALMECFFYSCSVRCSKTTCRSCHGSSAHMHTCIMNKHTDFGSRGRKLLVNSGLQLEVVGCAVNMMDLLECENRPQLCQFCTLRPPSTFLALNIIL